MLGGLVVHLLSQTRRFFALLVASTAAEAVLFLLWVIALLPFWSRDNSRESLRFEAVAHAVAAAVVAAQIFVSREEVLRSFGGDLGPPSIVRAAFGCVLLLWARGETRGGPRGRVRCGAHRQPRHLVDRCFGSAHATSCAAACPDAETRWRRRRSRETSRRRSVKSAATRGRAVCGGAKS